MVLFLTCCVGKLIDLSLPESKLALVALLDRLIELRLNLPHEHSEVRHPNNIVIDECSDRRVTETCHPVTLHSREPDLKFGFKIQRFASTWMASMTVVVPALLC
jgi:hypothetical protein